MLALSRHEHAASRQMGSMAENFRPWDSVRARSQSGQHPAHLCELTDALHARQRARLLEHWLQVAQLSIIQSHH